MNRALFCFVFVLGLCLNASAQDAGSLHHLFSQGMAPTQYFGGIL